jgi:ABC-type molybdenum transport system ATPase subunit/photorepair protein PhrA
MELDEDFRGYDFTKRTDYVKELNEYVAQNPRQLLTVAAQ